MIYYIFIIQAVEPSLDASPFLSRFHCSRPSLTLKGAITTRLVGVANVDSCIYPWTTTRAGWVKRGLSRRLLRRVITMLSLNRRKRLVVRRKRVDVPCARLSDLRRTRKSPRRESPCIIRFFPLAERKNPRALSPRFSRGGSQRESKGRSDSIRFPFFGEIANFL